MERNKILLGLFCTFFTFWTILKIEHVNAADNPKDLVISYTLPFNDGALTDMNVVVDLVSFQLCKEDKCLTICGTKNSSLAYCDKKNKKLCMCTPELFYTSELEGTVTPVDRTSIEHKNCSVACNKRNSYARIWKRQDQSQHCTCLMKQVTETGITLCDENAIIDLCKVICQTDTATCSFNGVCLCRKNWDSFFKEKIPMVRKELPEDNKECSTRCSFYHHDYIPRLLDSKMGKKVGSAADYKFREKYCLCGEWTDIGQNKDTKAILGQGFQLCTGLKCKRRCGMDEAICEPKLRRCCLCPRESIIIGNHLWSRLPNPGETKCHEACLAAGYDARVIEWNPFLIPEDQKFEPRYRKSAFQYLYDGKFCHCIKAVIDMHQYRPCTDELCRVICAHTEAVCDTRTRRNCFCNTHKLLQGIGRRPDPGELNCDISCRYGLFDAKIVDIKWEVPVDSWGVVVGKYCACIAEKTVAGLTHCDPENDECPTYCGVPEAYCTLEKYCWCGMVQNITSLNPLIRLADGREADECGERCRSWMWPMAEDNDAQPYIYDETLAVCGETDSCPKIDTSPWRPMKAGFYSVPDSLDKKEEGHRKFCLCAKSDKVVYKPGSRFLMHMEPKRYPKKMQCFLNHTCVVVGSGIHITS